MVLPATTSSGVIAVWRVSPTAPGVTLVGNIDQYSDELNKVRVPSAVPPDPVAKAVTMALGANPVTGLTREKGR